MIGLQKLPPQNIDAEECILASCLLGDTEPFGILEPIDFYKTAHQHTFQAAKSLYKTNTPIDIITVSDALKSMGFLEKCGGNSYLSRLVDTVPAAVSTSHYCKIIKEKSAKRQMIERCRKLVDSCYNDAPVEEISDQAKSLSENSLPTIDKKRTVDISNVYTSDKMLDEYKHYVEGMRNNRFITGIEEIDKRIRGIAGGETLFIIARAGAYKTALLQNLMRNYVNASSWASVFFSLEMPVANIAERYLQSVSKSTGWEVEQYYRHHQTDCIDAIEKRFREHLNRFFVVPTKVSISDMEKYVRLIEDRHKVRVGLIGVDYMGLVEESGSEYEQISKIARGSKDLAKFLNIPVIVLSQINRTGGSGETEVTLDMGRGSGAIEEAADFLFGLWKHDDALICAILKNRKGKAGSKWVLELDNTCFWIGPNATKFEKPKRTRKVSID